MAALAFTDASTPLGAFAAPILTLSADDTITINARKKQVIIFRNTTGGSLTCTIDGDGGTTVSAPGLPNIDVSAGYPVAVAAGASKVVVLSTISAYTKGVVHLLGASTLTAQLLEF